MIQQEHVCELTESSSLKFFCLFTCLILIFLNDTKSPVAPIITLDKSFIGKKKSE